MNLGTLGMSGLDAWTYGPLVVRAVATSGTPVDPILDTSGSTIYQWTRHNVDFDRNVTVQMQMQTIGAFSEGSGADAWCFRLPIPARRPVPGARGEFPLGTAMAYKSFSGPFMNVDCTPVLADPSWPQLRSDADSWIQIAVPYCFQVGSATITGTAGEDESVTVAHNLGYAPKPYDILPAITDGDGFASASAAYLTIQNIDTDSFGIVAGNVLDADTVSIAWKIMAEPPTGNCWLGPRKPVYWDLSALYNLFIQLRYEAA